MAKSPIAELASTTRFQGSSQHKIAEPPTVQTLPVIDNSVRTQSNVRTSIDCYVSGQYVQLNGKTIEVTQRYTIFVAYSHETQTQTMSQVRGQIMNDFQAKYGTSFNVSNVFVPVLPVPAANVPGIPPGAAEPLEMYGGSDFFKRQMSQYERARWEIGTERLKADINIQSIKKRYGVKR